MTNDINSRRLRLGMVGGGRAGSIGGSHRAAARMDGHWEIVAGVFSRDAAASADIARSLYIEEARAYRDHADMAQCEAARPDGIDAVTICTHNDTHFDIACAFLRQGIHVICDKPLTTSIEKARALVERTAETKVLFAVTHTYSGYPMVRMAREMIAAGELGMIRSVQVEYASQYQAAGVGEDDWQHDPQRSGPLGVVAGTGTHAHHLAEFVTGLRVESLAADLASLVEGHRLDDHAGMLLRFENGARGLLWNSTVAPGNENGLRIRVYGSRGGLEWDQEHPNHMRFTPLGGQSTVLSRGGPAASAQARRATRVPAGHPEGYLEAFANIYSDIAAAIRIPNRRSGDMTFPTVLDGARGVAFMFAALRSAQENGRFVSLAYGAVGA
ncbi:Gfo/Idh/MocA family protein [Shinella sp.]|uniref:Gfo/Idh/MocA family protein n=1 Tax=Shinella sp. TaxID=1870904 RepID=UPI003F71DCAB